MFWFKLNSISHVLLLVMGFLSSGNAHAVEVFSDDECMESSSKVLISHKGPPFGLTTNKIELDKKKCVMKIYYEKLKFLQSERVIDICRGPVHIKKGSSSIEVIKREGKCQRAEFAKTPFCHEWKKIKE